MDLGRLLVRVDGDVDRDEVAIATELIEKRAEVGEGRH
jgi:hypothetical protein